MLAHSTIFDNDNDAVSHGIPAEFLEFLGKSGNFHGNQNPNG